MSEDLLNDGGVAAAVRVPSALRRLMNVPEHTTWPVLQRAVTTNWDLIKRSNHRIDLDEATLNACGQYVEYRTFATILRRLKNKQRTDRRRAFRTLGEIASINGVGLVALVQLLNALDALADHPFGVPQQMLLGGHGQLAPSARAPTPRLAGNSPVPSTARQRDSRVNEARLHEFVVAYRELRSMRAVAEKYGITGQRVQQLLARGARLGIIEYPTTRRPLVADEIIEALRWAYSRHNFCARLQISTARISEALKIGDIAPADFRKTLAANQRDRRVHSALRELRGYLRNGRMPSTTELQATASGRSLYNRLVRLFGSYDGVRAAARRLIT